MYKVSILKLQILIYVLSSVILAACGQRLTAAPTMTLTVMPTESPTSTVTPFPTSTNTPAPTPTEAVKQFQQCTAQEYKDCYIAPKDLRAYADWTKKQLVEQGLTLPEPDPDKVIASEGSGPDRAFWYVGKNGANIIEANRPYLPGYAFGYTEADVVTDTIKRRATFAVTTVAFSVPDKPGEIVVVPVLGERAVDISDSEFIEGLEKWVNNGGMIMALVSNLSTMSIWYRIEPISSQNELAFPDLDAKIDEFEKTLDPTHIEGIIFKVFP